MQNLLVKFTAELETRLMLVKILCLMVILKMTIKITLKIMIRILYHAAL